MFRPWDWMLDRFGLALSVCVAISVTLFLGPMLWGWPSIASVIGQVLTFFGFLLYVAIRSAWLSMAPKRPPFRRRSARDRA